MPDPPADPAADLTALTQVRRWRGLIAVLITVTSAGVLYGLINPLVALRLEHMGIGTTWNGVNAAMPAIAAIIVAPLLPALNDRLGLPRVIILGAVLIVAPIPLFDFFPDVWVWSALRFVLGAGMMLHWVAAEIWINAAVEDSHRGRVLGASVALFSIGMACGPLVLGVMGTAGAWPFLIGAGIIILGTLPLAFAMDAAPSTRREGRGSLLAAARRAPTPMMAGFIEGFLFSAIFILLPLYAIRNGIEEGFAIGMLSAIAIGEIAVAIPIGWLADRMDRRLLLIYSGLAVFALCLLLPLLLGSAALLAVMLFTWGAASIGLYTLSLIRLGETFRPQELGPATAAFILVIQAGSIAGPIVGGLGMDAWDPHGLVVVLAVVSGLFCAFAIWRYRRVRARR